MRDVEKVSIRVDGNVTFENDVRKILCRIAHGFEVITNYCFLVLIVIARQVDLSEERLHVKVGRLGFGKLRIVEAIVFTVETQINFLLSV